MEVKGNIQRANLANGLNSYNLTGNLLTATCHCNFMLTFLLPLHLSPSLLPEWLELMHEAGQAVLTVSFLNF
jgi:hypothetical protein